MKILIIGGKKFLGRALVEDALSKNHEVTLFNRGKTNPELFPEVKTVVGDRDGQIANLGDGNWDVVIDTCGYVPRIVSQSVECLKDKVSQYIFISSISVYQESDEIGMNETAPLFELEDKTTEEIMGQPNNYGGLKVLCEKSVTEVYGENSVIIRPGLIVGPYDPTNRLTYWPVRLRKGGEVLAPGDGSMPTQFIDVRDLAAFTIDMIETKTAGTFNATGNVIPIKDLFDEIIKTTSSTPNINWASNEWLTENEVSPWMEMPLWIPTKEGDALMQVSIQKAKKSGLTIRPLSDIISGILNWYDEVDGDSQEWPAGMTPDKENTLIEKLNA